MAGSGDGECSHGVANECRVGEPMVLDEVCDVLGHGDIIMSGVMRRFAMVSEVLSLGC